MRSIFDESLEKIDTLMRDQIRHAWRNEKEIDKVVLVGGFSDSPALREYLGDSLQKLNKQAVHQGRQVDNIELVCSPINTGAASVAIGAVMRAMDKKNGPERTPRRSIGMLHHIPRNPEPGTYTSEVLSQSYTRAKVSDRDYIMNTIFWIIKAVSLI